MNYIQRWLDAQASIEVSQTDRFATIAKSFAGQSVSIPTIKEIIKAYATDEYRRLSLAATIAVCLDRPNHVAIVIPPKAIAVRTDIQPLWWIAVAIQCQQPHPQGVEACS